VLPQVTDLHRHFIDHLAIPSRQGKGVLRRVEEVFDCWFESGGWEGQAELAVSLRMYATIICRTLHANSCIAHQHASLPPCLLLLPA
jgi:hypothetical protein